MRARIGYAEALKILGENQSKVLKVLDGLLGGAILGVAAVTGLGSLGLLEARDELIKQSEKLLTSFGQRVRGASGRSRTDLLAAAHAMIAVNSYFEGLRDAHLPINLTQLQLTSAEQYGLAGAGVERSRDLVSALVQVPLPLPTSFRPFEQTVSDMREEYQAISQRLLRFVQGLAVWENQADAVRSEFADGVLADVPENAVRRYQDGFRRLAADSREFEIWMSQADSAASREATADLGRRLDTGLAGLQRLLETLVSEHQAARWPDQLARVYQAKLERPIAEISHREGQSGLTIPTLSDGYVNPHLRVAEYSAGGRPAEEDWWERAADCDDIQQFLARWLTSPAATEYPLVIMGQPGAGKSLLTKVLAARLPAEHYLPIRVDLRHVPAKAELQDQIESALCRDTGEDIRWPDLARTAADVLPVVILDGFDELLQGTEVSRADYLYDICGFQQREIDLGRQVAVLLTTRTAAANRMRFPDGTILADMDPFDEEQIEHWLSIWNDANATFFTNSELLPLPAEVVLEHMDLAEQPLLLLMLCFYDAGHNALQHHSDTLAQTDLYESLLTRFVERELEKRYRDFEDTRISKLRALELFRLAVIAFAMFNRGRTSVAKADLDADLAELRLAEDQGADDVKSAQSQTVRAEEIIPHFFFLHKSQTLVGDTTYEEYEFLHATFGEYLVARLVFRTIIELVRPAREPDGSKTTLAANSTPADSRLWKLLSFTPLSNNPGTISFLSELIGESGKEQNPGLRQELATLFAASLSPRQEGYGGYAPRRLSVFARHATYSANLLLLNVLGSPGELYASELFKAPGRGAEAWRSLAFLWRSQLDPAGWDGLINSLEVTRRRTPSGPDLTVHRRRRSVLFRRKNPLDQFRAADWLAAQSPDISKPAFVTDTGISAEKGILQAEFLCIPELDLLVHSLQPLLSQGTYAFRALAPGPDGHLASLMHLALAALLAQADTDESSVITKQALRLLERNETLGLWGRIRLWFMGQSQSETESLTRAITDYLALHETTTRVSSWLKRSLQSAPSPPVSLAEPADIFSELQQFFHNMGKDFGLTPSGDSVGIARVYENINPMQLAAYDTPLIASAIHFAREQALTQWASRQGLVLLAVLPTEKLAALEAQDVEFVLASAESEPGNGTVCQLIHDRYQIASS